MICTSDRERRHAPNTCAPYFLPSFSPSRFRRRVPRSGAPLHLRVRHSRERGGPAVPGHERGILIDDAEQQSRREHARHLPPPRPRGCQLYFLTPVKLAHHTTYKPTHQPNDRSQPRTSQPKCDKLTTTYPDRYRIYQSQ